MTVAEMTQKCELCVRQAGCMVQAASLSNSLALCGGPFNDWDTKTYLDTDGHTGGGDKPTIASELRKIHMCGSTVLRFETEDASETWYRPVNCMKFYCPTCGGKHGELHKKRISDVLSRVVLKGYFIRQFVFTVPESKREPFQRRDGLNALIRIVKRIVDKEFDKDKLMLFYIHLFGDQNKGKYHPHINVHIFEKDSGQSWKLPEEKLNRIRERYVRALSSYMKEKALIDVVNVNYSYRVGRGKVLHSIMYMTRPIDAEVLDNVDEGMKKFLLIEMKGFQYVRGYEMCKGKKNKEFLASVFGSWDAVEKKGIVSPITGKPLFAVDIVSAERFEMYTEGKRVEKRNGLLRIVDEGNI